MFRPNGELLAAPVSELSERDQVMVGVNGTTKKEVPDQESLAEQWETATPIDFPWKHHGMDIDESNDQVRLVNDGTILVKSRTGKIYR